MKESHDGVHADLTGQIIACAIEVHRHLGAGLLESVYESAMCRELQLQGLTFERQASVLMHYKEQPLSVHRMDLVVERAVIVEIKSVRRLEPIHLAQMLTYLRVAGLRVGLILNFNSVVMRDGIRRVVV